MFSEDGFASELSVDAAENRVSALVAIERLEAVPTGLLVVLMEQLVARWVRVRSALTRMKHWLSF